jgi:hypothetical protein
LNKPHIYKITNSVNGKYYYGVHNGNNTQDYNGSGRILKDAYKKYGKECWNKEILLWFNSVEEAYEYEAVIVNEKMVHKNNPMCYNIKVGGNGGWDHLTKNQLSDAGKKGGSKKKTITKSFTKAQGERSKGRKWINDGTNKKFVKSEELDNYLNSGWILGMPQSYKDKIAEGNRNAWKGKR